MAAALWQSPMAKQVALYNAPADPAAFDASDHASPLPSANTVPGQNGDDIPQRPVAGMGGPTGLPLIATLHFEWMAAIAAVMASPQRQATGGVEVMMFEEVRV